MPKIAWLSMVEHFTQADKVAPVEQHREQWRLRVCGIYICSCTTRISFSVIIIFGGQWSKALSITLCNVYFSVVIRNSVILPLFLLYEQIFCSFIMKDSCQTLSGELMDKVDSKVN